jgi:uncharacterized protein
VTAVFADTLYWIALTNRRDQWHQNALNIAEQLQSAQLVTTEIVLIELLNYFCTYGAQARQTLVAVARSILTDQNVEVVLYTQELFAAGLTLYEQRLDKGYSLTDCISMVVMRDRQITAALTHDRHFAQEGFQVLL